MKNIMPKFILAPIALLGLMEMQSAHAAFRTESEVRVESAYLATTVNWLPDSQYTSEASTECDWKYGDQEPASVFPKPPKLKDIIICEEPADGFYYKITINAEDFVDWTEATMDELGETYTPNNFELVWQQDPQDAATQGDCSDDMGQYTVNTGTNFLYTAWFYGKKWERQSLCVKIIYTRDDGTHRYNYAYFHASMIPK